MRRRLACALPLLLLVATPLAAQELSLQSATFMQLAQEKLPGLDTRNLAQGVQFLGVDATGLKLDNLSLHLFGWGSRDFGAPAEEGRRSEGDLSYAYLRYRFDQSNAELQAGRLMVAQHGGFEWLDGVSGRTDLKGGFTLSAFGGQPVWFRTLGGLDQIDHDYQRDFIFGARLGKRFTRWAELGLSFLQDGTKPAHALHQPSTYDFTRRHLGLDLRVLGPGGVDFQGRTVWDIARHPALSEGASPSSRIAEHEYSVSGRASSSVVLTGSYTQRNFRAFYAGTTLPTLFHPDEGSNAFTAYAAKATWDANDELQVVADYRHSQREGYGKAQRMGAEARYKPEGTKAMAGFGLHRVLADDTVPVGSKILAYGLSHTELRLWSLFTQGRASASLDAIYHHFDDLRNPVLAGKNSEYELIGSLGYQLRENLRLSADLSFGSNPVYKQETRALMRLEYRFTTKAKGEGQ